MSRSPLADVVPNWDKLNSGEKAAISKQFKQHLRKLSELPSTDPRYLRFRRQMRELLLLEAKLFE